MKQDMSTAAPVSRPLSSRLGAHAKFMIRVAKADKRVVVVLRLLPYAELDTIRQIIINAGGKPSTWMSTQCVLAAEMPLSGLDKLARAEGVVSVEIDSKIGPL